MTLLALDDVLAATGGELRANLPRRTVFPRIQRDSRQAASGDLFIAIRGERFDGHEFVEDAINRGATAALVARDWAATQPMDGHLPLIVVENPVAALGHIAKYWRSKLNPVVIGITGSVGKTSTKEVVAAVLRGRFETYKSPGNLNNEIGLPLSLLEVQADTEVVVLEMGGAYAHGELTYLAGIAQPQVAVVTNIYPVHLERMGTIEAIAQTKSELVAALPPNGIAILNGDDQRVLAMADLAPGRVITYGLGRHCEVLADQVVTDGLNGTSFRLHLGGETYHIKVPLIGGHSVDLALAAIATGHALDLHISEILPGFDDPTIQVRLLVQEGPNGSQIIDDTYNASTPSVLSALGLLQELTTGSSRAIAVLGDMRELGAVEEEEHRVVGRRAAEVADVLVTFGNLARIIADEAALTPPVEGRIDAPRPAVTSFGLDERDELVRFLLTELRAGDVVLVKGSRGLAMEWLVRQLVDSPSEHHSDSPVA